jgi:serine/threonine protein kinase
MAADEQLDFRRDINPNTQYELTSLLGEGSYGAVYKARSRIIKSGREVAVKIIPDADDDLTSLWREIKFLQDLRSPFVVSFIESLLFDNELWLVMELCDGGSLYDIKEAKKSPLEEPQIKAIMAFSVLGLAHLHGQMSIHRDVKSGNILLTTDGRAKLGDFGISAQLTDTIMKRRTVIGSPYWMAPEVIQEASCK